MQSRCCFIWLWEFYFLFCFAWFQPSFLLGANMSRLSFPPNRLFENTEPICPYCGQQNEIEDTDFHNEELFRKDCQKCGRNFWVAAIINLRFSTVGDCQKHRLKLSVILDHGDKKYVCVDCQGYIYSWQLPGGKYPKIAEGEFEFVEGGSGEIQQRRDEIF